MERYTSIEAEVKIAGDEWIIREPGVFSCIGHHHRLRFNDCMGAEADIPGCTVDVCTPRRFVPLSIGIDHREKNHRHFENIGDQLCEVVEPWFTRRVENI